MSLEDAVTPAKNATPIATIANIAINLPNVLLISRKRSFHTDFPILNNPP